MTYWRHTLLLLLLALRAMETLLPMLMLLLFRASVVREQLPA